MGRSYTIDFNTLQQINEDTGTARAVQRKANVTTGGSQSAGGGSNVLEYGAICLICGIHEIKRVLELREHMPH